MELKALIKSPAAKNAGWIMAGKLCSKLFAFVVSIFTARYLGPGDLGLVAYVGAYTTFFAAISSFGINSVMLKELMDSPEGEGETLGTALVLKAGGGVLSTLMIAGVVSLADRGEGLTAAAAVLHSLSLAFSSFDCISYWFQSRLKSKYSASAAAAACAVSAAYKIALLFFGKSVLWFAAASAVESLCCGAMLLAAYRAKRGPSFRFSKEKAKGLLRSGFGFMLSGLMIAVYAAADKLMLRQMLSDAAVGHYSLALSVSTCWVFVLTGIIDSAYPGIVSAHGTDRELFLCRLRRLFAVVFGISALVSLAVCLFSKPFVLLLYGGAYLPAAKILKILPWHTAFSFLGVARDIWIVCEKRQNCLKYVYLLSALLNVGLNLLLIPLWGAAGAAAATVATQIACMLLIPAAFSPLRESVVLILQALTFQNRFFPAEKAGERNENNGNS